MAKEVLLPCVKAHLMSVRQALYWLEFHPDTVRGEVLLQLVPSVDDTDLIHVLDACRSLRDNALRARCLAEVARRLRDSERIAVISEIVSCIVRVQEVHRLSLGQYDRKLISETIARIAEYLDSPQRATATAMTTAMTYDEKSGIGPLSNRLRSAHR